MNESVRFHNVTKKYKMHSKNSEKLKDILYPGGFGEDFYALRNLEFEAQKGDVIGIVGVNGSGKSTMSNLIAGITPPTTGSIDIKGKVALIAIAAGLNNQLSGRENIELKCLMMGMSKAQIEKLTPEIIDFADIGKFIDMPVKKYSSGMKSRLGFAISVSINPDVLVIDEALSVGDQTFADKCLNRMNEFKEQGKTIFFVSHSLGQVKKFCTKALWLEYGEIRDYGPIEEVMPKYESFLKEYKAMSKEEQQNFKKEAMEKQAGKGLAEVNIASKEVPKEASNYAPRLSGAHVHSKNNRIKRKYIAGLIGVLLITTISGLTYWQRDNIFSPLQAKEQKKEQSRQAKVVKQEKNPLADLDVRYVNSAKARVRSVPALEGQAIATMVFGTPFVVKDQKKDEKSGVNWLKAIYDNGEEGWVSEEIVSSIPFTHALSYEDVVNKIKKLEGTSQNLEQALTFLGKRKEDVTSIIGIPQNEEKVPEGVLTKYKEIDVLYNNQLIVKQVSLKNVNILKATLLEQLGEAQLKNEDSSLLIYRSDKFDFKFASNGSTIEQISIFDILK
ncbi:teichoic acids export ABC transporter ATP-binding subunit TagH [Bacillus cereus group sp. N21]|uniref:teichoic acids export ABC transporter ATP-binding subunit TagH n=1 Tax=Bacillus cereus group sp. N21 TaxID=2794591 RepID=UPI0018F71958|nr:teichoic acids export ABC transporter ATP-binding subunit TagH [Bacillus cereus group sp. N21]MBJ8026403.1 teichoic acids export ABC transporter ATP-binding subunit TagH [Bacillus cereus group sp. N21]